MPPRTRGVKLLKACKENIDISNKNKVKVTQKSTKPARRPLADKTNSASDENASPEPRKKVLKESTKTTHKVVPKVTKVIEEVRPRRNRRLPTRYVENQVLTNLSNSKETSTTPSKRSSKTPVESASKVESPFKTPTNGNDSLVLNRERRVCRLPSKFDDSISPSKFLPIQPCHTSTPLVTNPKDQSRNVKKSNNKLPSKTTPSKKVSPLKVSPVKNPPKQITPQKTVPDKPAGRKLVQKKINELVNTAVRQDRTKRLRKIVEYKEATLSPKPSSPVKSKTKTTAVKITSQANSSYRILEEKKSNKGESQDVYEFTFDPSEEPQKKKRKKVTHKKPSKPKQRVYNNNYEKNLARALADLKNVVSKQKQGNVETASEVVKPTPSTANANHLPVQTSVAPTGSKSVLIPTSVVISTTADVHQPASNNNSVRGNLSNKNHASIRVEDIAADFAATIDHHDDINYSPVNSPGHHPVESNNTGNVSPVREAKRPDDPLNLRNDLSFFDEQPVASSSMNMSNRNPMSTPWRVEFEKLPIKWQSNTYVKPDMTPALESSYVNNFDDSKKKHVYTDMVEQVNETIPNIVEDEAPKLKQTSIISFIKEVVERSANKKRRMGSRTPTKANSLFDVTNTSANDKTHNKQTSGASSNNASSEKETSAEGKNSQKRKNDDDNNPTPARKNDNTLFGFDDSENQEQENISPVKVANPKKLRNLISRSNAVLKDLNKQAGPMRAELPAAMKAKLAPSSDVVEKIYDQMKSAADAPVLLDRQDGGENTVTELPKDVQDDEDSQSIHLFEDVQLIHHLKPTRKSYGKSKKVAFDQPSSDSGDEAPVRNVSSDDDADDLSFHLPEIKPKKAVKKKKSKKQLLSKKEKAEVDAWAANFNSMCEDVEEFDLVVE